jgi:hypothetical protein
MRRLLREPLVHFLLSGAGLFLLYGLTAAEPGARAERIVVSEAQVASLARIFERTWLRAPLPSELDGLVQDFVDEEILYREALALGLDRDDPVVRRRLRQKMEFLHADLGGPPEPGEGELTAYLAARPDPFVEPARLSFDQVYVRPDDGGTNAGRRAKELLARLRAGEAAETLGDRTLLPGAMERASERDIAAAFGTGFAGDLLRVPSDDWTGPLASSFGLHLVRIRQRTPQRTPALEEIRARVEREWRTEQRAASNAAFLKDLRERYDVEVRMPNNGSVPTLASQAP